MIRHLIPAALPLFLALMFGASASAAPALQSPTFTPTPAPQNQPVSSFHVDTHQEPPWDVPILPTWGTGTPQPTLYAATPPHSTDYPDQVATATMQISAFTGPISAVSTPVAGMIEAGPTTTSGDIDTGLDPLGTNITFSSFGSQMSDDIIELVGTAKVFIIDLVELGTYSPWMAPLPVMLIASTVIGMFIGMITLVVKGGSWLLNLLIKIFTFIGVWKPG